MCRSLLIVCWNCVEFNFKFDGSFAELQRGQLQDVREHESVHAAMQQPRQPGRRSAAAHPPRLMLYAAATTQHRRPSFCVLLVLTTASFLHHEALIRCFWLKAA
jgi:hypothetical protein